MKWTRQDKLGVRGTLDSLASKEGGYSGLATKLGEKNRATVFNWRGRGAVPIDKVPTVIQLARTHGITVTGGQLNPQVKAVETA